MSLLFEQYSSRQGEYLLKSDTPHANQLAKKITKITSQILHDDDALQYVVARNLCSPTPNTQLWTCVLALRGNYMKDEALHIVKRLSEDEVYGVISLNAVLLLDEFDRQRETER